ncbi:hypothetical protein KIW84_043191 [Lathyrus oleraceus]|uniref:Uncharacterized protein n=1 Tax=Pisum sativum TaxID=3888 RepID=A0A9D4XEJ4_PEA|nr:hypothetical protein KIW84_043191 [Pisum sativum]
MLVYAKFMKVLLLGKWILKHDKNMALAEECSEIIQSKLPPKLIDPGVAVEIIDPGDAHIFVVKGEKLRTYGGSKNASGKVSLMLVGP